VCLTKDAAAFKKVGVAFEQLAAAFALHCAVMSMTATHVNSVVVRTRPRRANRFGRVAGSGEWRPAGLMG
jgi:hypothetical protein